MRNAEHIGMLRILGISMRVADELFGSEAPCDVQNYIDNDREVQRIGAGVCRLLRSGEELPVNTFAYFRLMTDVRERYRDRFRFALRLATTPGLGEWTAVQLPPRMYPLYRLMRVGRLATRFMRWS
jgi:hypothetical protein